MVKSWKAITRGSITCTNQTSTAYWKRIKTKVDERKFTKEYFKVTMEHEQGTIKHRWRIIQRAINKFHGCHENIHDRQESGKGPSNLVSVGLPSP